MKEQISVEIIEHAFKEYYGALHRYAYTVTRKMNRQEILCNRYSCRSGNEKINSSSAVHSNLISSGLFITIVLISGHGHRKFIPLDLIPSTGEESGKDKSVEATELRALIHAAIEKLPTQCRIVFLKSREEEKTYSQVADEMGIALKTVEAQMTKALKILRTELAEHLVCLVMIDLIFKN